MSGLPFLSDPHDVLPQAVGRLHRQHAVRAVGGRQEGGAAVHQRRIHQDRCQVWMLRLLLLG